MRDKIRGKSRTRGRFLLTIFFIYTSCILLPISSPQKALALGNVFIVTMLGNSQQPGFAPDLLTVQVYDTVVFVNSTGTPIGVTAIDNNFASPAIAPGKQWKVTFNSPGAFEYHENSSTPHTFGEIVVVPNTVALLPSPAPAAQQTAIAYIQSGKTPPDTVWRQITQTQSARPGSTNKTGSLSASPLALLFNFVRPVILVVLLLLTLFAAVRGGLWLYRRWQSRPREDDDENDEDDTDE